MRLVPALALLLLVAESASAQNMVITGVVRNLDGTPLAALNNFTVEAFSGGNSVATGTVTAAAPFVYTISIPANGVTPADVRVLLSFRATGRDPVDLNPVVGKAAVIQNGQVVAVNGSQTIDIVMPEATPPCLECNPACEVIEQHSRFFRRLLHR
jgi:hypothetical protein